MDLMAASVILLREAGYIRAKDACQRLNLPPGRLLALRRRLLETALGHRLPPLAVEEGDAIPLGKEPIPEN